MKLYLAVIYTSLFFSIMIKGDSKIQDYLKDLNNKNIPAEIFKINSIYEKIIEINRLIKLTDFICIDDLPKIKKESQDMKELNKLQEQCATPDNLVGVFDKTPDRSIIYEGRFSSSNLINDKIQKLNYLNQGNCWKDEIQRRYRVINNNNNNKDIVILGLELIKFNLEHKKKLKEIFEEYYSEDFIKDLLSKLYEKDIDNYKMEI